MNGIESDKVGAVQESPIDARPDMVPYGSLADVKSETRVFASPMLEATYRQTEFTEHKHTIGVNVALAGLAIFGFAVLDPWLLRADLVEHFRVVRLVVLCPIAIVTWLIWRRTRLASTWIRVGGISVFVCGLAWSYLLYVGRDSAFAYLSLALIQTTVGTFFLVGLPVRWSLPIAYAHTAIFVAAAIAFTSDWSLILVFGVGFITINLFGGFGARRYEAASRRQFIAQMVSEEEHKQRLSIEADRNHWLSVIAAFLRHELKNAMTGVATSIDLATRTNKEARVQELLDRAARSTDFMRRLMAQAVEATSLEQALTTREVESVNLSELIAGLLNDFAADTGRAFVADIKSEVRVHGSPDRLVQMFEKLLNNAIEHGDPRYPIDVRLLSDSERAVVSIENRGDPLPRHLDALFEVFVSYKIAKGDASGLGLGLFIAKKIATSHHGDIRVAALADPAGARFEVWLPLNVGSATRALDS